jgi:hypothetical protein
MTTQPEILNPWRTVRALTLELNHGAAVPILSEHAIRHMLRHAATNGLERHTRWMGTKLLINAIGFQEWLDAHPRRRLVPAPPRRKTMAMA